MKFELDERFTEVTSEEMQMVEGGGKLTYRFKSKFTKVLSGIAGLHPFIKLAEAIANVLPVCPFDKN